MTLSEAYSFITSIVRTGLLCILLAGLASPFADRSDEVNEPPVRYGEPTCTPSFDPNLGMPPTCGLNL